MTKIKKKYTPPRILLHKMKVVLTTTSPGVDDDEYDPNEFIEAKQQNFFNFIGNDDEE